MTIPVDIIKIDKSFVDNIVTHEASAAIVEALIGIARKLGIKVAVEGVATLGQVRLLTDLGCVLGQGFYYSEAVSGQDVGDLMLRLAEGIHGARSRPYIVRS